MSNKRNPRRSGQKIRSELNRKPVKITKGITAFIDSQSAERARKKEDRYWKRPNKKTRLMWAKDRRKALFTGKRRRRWKGKPRTTHGATYWRHSHDI